jgi:hypothetical protein
MPLFWFLFGALVTLAALALSSPWLKSLSRFGSLTATPPRALVTAAVLVAMIFGLYEGLGRPRFSGASLAPETTAEITVGEAKPTAFGAAAKVFGASTDASAPLVNSASPAPPQVGANAGSMDSAIANLQSRLAKGGGTNGDWELLAKSFEFLGRPADAANARAHRLTLGTAANDPAVPPRGASIRGSVTLDPTLLAKAAAGDTLFIVAKSVDSPSIPVAVVRTRVGAWPVQFTLDDSQSMMPGRTLSAAGRVTVEARISKKGQPLPAVGDLQGTSGVIDPTARVQPLQIKIDNVIP